MQLVLIVAVVVAAICVGYVAVSWILEEYRRHYIWRAASRRQAHAEDEAEHHERQRIGSRRLIPSTGDRERLAVLLIAVLLLVLGAATAAVDEKVANATHGEADRIPATGGTDDGAAFGSESGWGGDSEWEGSRQRSEAPSGGGGADYFASHMSSFREPAILHAGTGGKELCLVRYFARKVAEDHGGNPGTTWWTTCRYNATLTSIVKARAKLALPRSWGKRDARVIADIPPSASLVYLSGHAAEQCESSGKCYPGGGAQMLFKDGEVQRRWLNRLECATGPEAAPARFVPCHFKP